MEDKVIETPSEDVQATPASSETSKADLAKADSATAQKTTKAHKSASKKSKGHHKKTKTNKHDKKRGKKHISSSSESSSEEEEDSDEDTDTSTSETESDDHASKKHMQETVKQIMRKLQKKKSKKAGRRSTDSDSDDSTGPESEGSDEDEYDDTPHRRHKRGRTSRGRRSNRVVEDTEEDDAVQQNDTLYQIDDIQAMLDNLRVQATRQQTSGGRGTRGGWGLAGSRKQLHFRDISRSSYGSRSASPPTHGGRRGKKSGRGHGKPQYKRIDEIWDSKLAFSVISESSLLTVQTTSTAIDWSIQPTPRTMYMTNTSSLSAEPLVSIDEV